MIKILNEATKEELESAVNSFIKITKPDRIEIRCALGHHAGIFTWYAWIEYQ